MNINVSDDTKESRDCLTVFIDEIPYKVYLEGNPKGPPLITIHDIFMDHTCCFSRLFKAKTSERIRSVYNIHHIILPGQDIGVSTISGPYPSSKKLANDISELIKFHLKLTNVVAIASGFGSYLVVQCALNDNHLFCSMILANFHPSSCSFMDYIGWKFFLLSLEAPGMGMMTLKCRQKIIDYMLGVNSQEAHLIGDHRNQSYLLLENYLSSISDTSNLHNLLTCYLQREDVSLLPRTQFDTSSSSDQKPNNSHLQCNTNLQHIGPCLLVYGRQYYYFEEVDAAQELFQIQKCERLILDGASTVLNDNPEEVMHSISLFLFGQDRLPGYVLHDGNHKVRKLQSIMV